MSAIACFGKLPSAADFVRRGVSGTTMRSFEDWFHDSYTALRGAGERGLPHTCVTTWPVAGGRDGAVVAVALPSRDRIGREFPMVVAASLSRDFLAAGSAALALGVARFVSAAAAAFESHRDGDAEPWFDAAGVLPPPTIAETSDAQRRWSELRAHLGARQLEQDCFESPDDRFYAYHTLRLAVKDAPSGRVVASPTARNPAYRAFWLETIERAAGDGQPLSALWLEGIDAPDPVMTAFGKPPPAMLSFAFGHNQRSAALWPLTTTHDAARSRSKAALSAGDWDQPDQNLGTLIDAVLSTAI